MKAVIDRFEGDYAVMEIEGRMQNVPWRELPAGVREGDVLDYVDRQWLLQPAATAEVKKKIDKLAEELWED